MGEFDLRLGFECGGFFLLYNEQGECGREEKKKNADGKSEEKRERKRSLMEVWS